MRFLAYFFAGMIVASAVPAVAADMITPPAGLYPPVDQRQSDSSRRRYAGQRMSMENTSHTTTDRVQFGFQSNWVSICVRGGLASTVGVYFRFEFDASTDNWADRLATQSSYYINGTAGIAGLGTQAGVISGGGDGTDAKCASFPVQARGLTVHMPTQNTATLDVIAQ